MDIKFYNRARIEIESRFSGIPYVHSTLVSALITRANPNNGIINDLSYHDLGSLLSVATAPGRKDAGIPTKSRLRSILRTIEATCGNDFKVVSEGSQLIIQFTSIPHVYAEHGLIEEQTPDQITGLNTQKYLEKSSINDVIASVQNQDLVTDLNLEKSNYSSPVKNNNYLNKNKTNNNKPDSSKSLISDSFFPSAETLIRAREKGFENADDLAEIQAFIDHNKAIGSQWADFNPIYLRWLENGKERKARRTDAEKSGRVNNGTSCKTNKKSPKQRVIDAHSNEHDYCERTSRFYPKGTTPFSEQPAPKPVKYIDIDSLGPID